MASAIIRVESLNSGYSGSQVLYDINFEAIRGQNTVIVGPNGSGKSSLLKSIFGLCTVYSGSIYFEEESITGLDPHVVARKGIVYLPQRDNVFVNLSITENLRMAGYTVDAGTVSERISKTLEIFPALSGYQRSQAGVLSGGQRQMLAMAMAMMRQPTVMLFDEPTASLSPKLAGQVLEKIKQIRDEYDITTIIVEQNVRRALEGADGVYLLANGKNVYDGSPKNLLDDPRLAQMYLGIG